MQKLGLGVRLQCRLFLGAEGNEPQRRRRLERDAEGVVGVRSGEGISPSPADYRVWVIVISSPRAEIKFCNIRIL